MPDCSRSAMPSTEWKSVIASLLAKASNAWSASLEVTQCKFVFSGGREVTGEYSEDFREPAYCLRLERPCGRACRCRR